MSLNRVSNRRSMTGSLPRSIRDGREYLKCCYSQSSPRNSRTTMRRVSLLSQQGGGEMRIGYARVSTTEQNLDLQRDALKWSGCERIIEETASGGKVQRSGLERVGNAPAGRCAGGVATRPAG